MLKCVDLDGDGGDDLVILDGVDRRPDPRPVLRPRAASSAPSSGSPSSRSGPIAFGQVDGKTGAELLTIEAPVGPRQGPDPRRGRRRRGRQPRPPDLLPAAPGQRRRGRSLDLGDLDGDGKADVVATDPANAQFLVYRQAARPGLGTGQSFPGLVGRQDRPLADLDGDEQGRGLRPLRAGEADRPERPGGRPPDLPRPPAHQRRPGRARRGRPRRRQARPRSSTSPAARRPTAPTTSALRRLKREKSGTFVPFRWGQADSVAAQGPLGRARRPCRCWT